MQDRNTWRGYRMGSGALNYTCLICHALVSPLVDDLNMHRQWHANMASLHTWKDPEEE